MFQSTSRECAWSPPGGPTPGYARTPGQVGYAGTARHTP
jgi:hypothetical protein